LMFAILPPHVRESHFVLTDVPLTLAVAATWLLSLRAAERPSWAGLLVASLVAGLTGAVKYNGGLAVIMPLVAASAYGPRRLGRAFALVAIGTMAGFLAGAPYTILDLPGFLDGFAHLSQSYNRPVAHSQAAAIYLSHMRNWFSWPGVIQLEFGYAALAVGVVGAVRLFARVPSPARWARVAMTLAFPAAYFWFVSGHGSLQYGRYLLPVTPMLVTVIAAGAAEIGAAAGASLPVMRRAMLPAIVCLLLIAPAAAAVSWDMAQARVSTSDQAALWLAQHAANDQPIVIEDTAAQLPPRMKTMQVRHLIDQTAEQYRQDGVVYLVASSAEADRYLADPIGRSGEIAALKALFAETQTVAIFTPGPDHPGPGLRILKVPR
jgi:MFS family permease